MYVDVLLPYVPWLLAAAAVLSLVALVLLIVDRRRRSNWLAGESRQDLGREIGVLCRELQDATRRIDRHVETRITQLQQLLNQADRRIGQLRLPDTDPPADAHLPAGSLAPDRRLIVQLHRQGVTNEQIARAAGMEVGEVELILNLERASQSADAGR